MITYEYLVKEFEKKVAELQRTCQHTHISDWIDIADMHFNKTGDRKRVCRICNKTTHFQGYRLKCLVCKNIYPRYMVDCPECKQKLENFFMSEVNL